MFTLENLVRENATLRQENEELKKKIEQLERETISHAIDKHHWLNRLRRTKRYSLNEDKVY